MSKGTYMGKALEDMSKQELIDAVEKLGKLVQDIYISHSNDLKNFVDVI